MKTVFVIFGATGDLSRSKLYPALFELFRKGLFDGRVIGCARTPATADEFRQMASAHIARKGEKLDGFLSRFSYAQADFEEKSPFKALKREIGKDADKVICHLAVPEGAFLPIVRGLLRAYPRHVRHAKFRILVEKPFGHDLKSARKLNRSMRHAVGEQNIYRIDHFLAKEVVENLLIVRFANELFRAVWNKRHIECVQVSFSEQHGMGTRGPFYEKTGALKDFVQSHIMQVLGLLAMEQPKCLDDECIKDEKAKVLQGLGPLRAEDVVFGQYRAGRVGAERVPGYRQEEGVARGSKVETFVAMRVFINMPGWEGVPFYIRTGKRMKEKKGHISVIFKKSHHFAFGQAGGMPPQNVLQLEIDPEEMFRLSFNLKTPEKEVSIKPFSMEYCYSCEHVGNRRTPYEKIFEDAMNGAKTRFSRSDEVEHAWRWVESLKKKPKLHFYPAGSDGPAAAEKLLESHGHGWIG